ncbi:MAG TPA: UDP-N-acetylmuramoyl-tripeptide--D-alanyl-D-alanine ligase [Alphaproteobacteria bacterium]|nr:UDP-N-acetylmuramoyl-tripeptide--D-alanyl-D-alanine ligase [Alphaproteobacteria bacterium]HOO50533.1 UDP-N-acetylmuramoyl-tripeptide--D-alanyl-D-alanine ligase [Alphaproteobacteria bacterium]
MTAHLNSSSHSLWTATEAAAATSGTASGDWIATGIAIDSRTTKKGDLFIAIRGDNTNGHKFARAAIENGAVAVVVDENVDGIPQEKILKVEDTFKAMQDLGRAARARTASKIIGITGSVGKTGTKEMLGRAFSALGQTHYSEKSLNNHWGVPLSLSRMHAGSDFGIFEMGMNHANEITPLTEMVKPHVAIITTIASVHAEHFPDGVNGIAKAKAEIFSSMDEHGIAILNADIAQFELLRAEAQKSGIKKIFTFGKSNAADARLTDCLIASNGTRITANIMGEEVSFTLKDAGEHIALNALSVLLAVKLLGHDMAKAIEGLKGIEPPAGRGKRELIDIGDKNNPVTLIDESYNASPIAMEAAFKVMALIDPGRGGRRIAILGDMYELGSNAPQIHKDLALPLQAAGVDLVYTCGPLMKNLYDAIPEQNRGAHTNDAPELAKIVPDVLVPGDVVLVKGSRGGGEIPRMQMVVEAMREIPKNMSQNANKLSEGM